MDREDIERMAREAGIRLPTERFPALGSFTLPELMHFSDLIAAAERERNAKIAEETVCDTHLPTGVRIYGTRVAKAIRGQV